MCGADIGCCEPNIELNRCACSKRYWWIERCEVVAEVALYRIGIALAGVFDAVNGRRKAAGVRNAALDWLRAFDANGKGRERDIGNRDACFPRL